MRSAVLYDVRPAVDLKDLLEQSVKLFGDHNAFLVKDGDGCYYGISYKRFKSDVDAFGAALLSLGLKDGFIAVAGENRYEWCVTYLSVVNHTGTIVPLDKELPVAEKENLLERSAARAVVFSGKYTQEMATIKQKMSSVEYYIHMDIEEDQDGFLSYKKLVKKGREILSEDPDILKQVPIDNTQMRILLFTSGTTDLAKGVMLSHRNICSNITSVRKTVYIGKEDTTLSILPLHHTYECTIGFLTMIYSGGTIAFCEGLKQIAKNMKEVRPTILVTVPLILENMYRKIWDQAAKKMGLTTKLKVAMFVSNLLYKGFKLDIRRKLFKTIHENIGGRIRMIVTGAAAIDPEVSKNMRKLGIHVLQGYGLTECSPLVAGNRDRDFLDAAAGIPIPGVEVKIMNPGENGIGEIAVRGDNVMLGYYKNEKATASCMRDGWFYTGDLGKMDRQGFLYITGRCKNVIVTKNGKNIFPEEVEAYINKSPYVQESLVWGFYDKDSGETYVNAQIFPNLEAIREKLKKVNVSKEEIMKTIREIVRSVNKEMPLYKRIRDFTIRETEFIKTTTRKIKRYAEKIT